MTRQTVHLYVFDGLADWETGHATAHINTPEYQREPGRYQVRTVGEAIRPVTSTGGLTITPDLALADLAPARSAMLILPGGASWDTDPDARAAAVAAAGELLAAGVPVAAICGATAGLARAGLLDDRAHTSNTREYLAATGYGGAAHYRDVPAVTDRDVITAPGTAPVDFARHIFARLALYEPEVLAMWAGLFGARGS
ncbi:MAG TPA: DJ-1/PfpI family protein [Gemmatimonadaceae bacterium]|nr:DJ-1/PfpI family protein [Gemmatimonadaceae bacterium]